MLRLSRVMFLLLTGLAGVTVLAGGLLLYSAARQEARKAAQAAPLGRGVVAGSPAVGGPFALVDHDGREVTDATYRGEYLLVFFGFANCPDVCPMALDRFARVMELLGPDGERVRPLLVSVDPERDTPAILKGYVTSFHPRTVGLTGSAEQVKAAAARYRVYFAKAETGGAADYSVDHSAFEYLMGPDGRNLYIFTAAAEPERIAELIRGAIRG